MKHPSCSVQVSGFQWALRLHHNTPCSSAEASAAVPRPRPGAIPARCPSVWARQPAERGAAPAGRMLPASLARRERPEPPSASPAGPAAAAHVNSSPFINDTFDFRKIQAKCSVSIRTDVYIHTRICNNIMSISACTRVKSEAQSNSGQQGSGEVV